jgi:hypothetical protein
MDIMPVGPSGIASTMVSRKQRFLVGPFIVSIIHFAVGAAYGPMHNLLADESLSWGGIYILFFFMSTPLVFLISMATFAKTKSQQSFNRVLLIWIGLHALFFAFYTIALFAGLA